MSEARPITGAVERRIVEVIQASLAHTGSPPSMREIADALHISTSSVMQHLDRMADRGVLRKVGAVGRARGYLPAVPKHHCPACGQALAQTA